ncbi:MAG: hypothetical protein AAFQ94_20275 [Bacteroidota bacterium]
MKYFNTVLIVFVLLLTVCPAFAQGAPPATPIDGGLSALLIAGGLYGAKKIHDHSKRSQ